MQPDNRLIVALDFNTFDEVKKMVEQLDDFVSFYKVGMELFYSVGPQIISFLKQKNKNIFLDLKVHDIPNTVAKSLAALTGLGISMVNLHASGGYAMMAQAGQAVAEAAQKYGIPKPCILGVTVLTSMNDQEWNKLGHNVPITEQVIRLAKLTQQAGLDGVVASPQEAGQIRAACGERFAIVTPGVRPSGSAVNDQARIATPADALRAGSTHLVVGRPITQAQDPRGMAEQIIREMRES